MVMRHEPLVVSVREPILQPVAINRLRPTQMTVGMWEVNAKRKHWRKLPEKKRAEFLSKHMVPVILGPKERRYIIDHHHLARALRDEGVKEVMVVAVAELTHLKQDAFWIVLDHHSWVCPYDKKGLRRDYNDIPKSISDLKDDPFRSLAGELRRTGGYAKDTTPFSEFLWADFLRRQLKRTINEKNFQIALKEASKLAKSQEAKYLPGWCGPSEG